MMNNMDLGKVNHAISIYIINIIGQRTSVDLQHSLNVKKLLTELTVHCFCINC